MKKILFVLSLGLTGCATNGVLIQKSEIAITTQDTSRVWFLDGGYGPSIYTIWKNGTYGTASKVYLVDSTHFEKLKSRVSPQYRNGYTTMLSPTKTGQ